MCTVIVARQVGPLPLVVAANRDEMVARPASSPRRIELADAPVIACGLDEVRGGTWMGVNGVGIFAALTNQPALDPPDRSLRTRGEVVMGALRRRDPGAIRAYLRALDPRRYNGFNLIYGDAETVEVAYARPDVEAVAIESVPPGIHVLPNDVIDSPRFPKVERARALAEAIDWEGSSFPELAERLARVLADHTLPDRVEPVPRLDPEVARALQAICIHLPFYGTRSATIAALEPGRIAHYLFAAGPPCTAPFVDYLHLLAK